MMRKIIFLFILVSSIFRAQNNIDKSLPDIKPPSAETYKFSIYGLDFKNSSSGEFNYNFPLYTVGNSISMPINLAYNSGVKVDDIGGNVGMSWQLIAGGAISRIVRDEQDETANSFWFPQNIDVATQANQIKGAAHPDNSIDTEYDWFSFSLSNGLYGQFYIDKNLNVHYNAGDGSKLILTDKTTMVTQYGKNLEFMLIDNQGNKYFFGGEEKFMERSKINYKGPDKYYTSGWYLAKVITNNNEIINFDYNIETISYYSSMSASFTVSESCCVPNTHENSGIAKSMTTMLSLRPRLISIQDDKSVVNFLYNKTRTDLINNGGSLLTSVAVIPKGSNIQLKNYVIQYDDLNSGYATTYYGLPFNEQSTVNRHFLKKIENTVSNEVFNFEYYFKENLPARFSLSTDMYGYSNGKSNQTPFPNIQGQVPTVIFNKTSGYALADKSVDPTRTFTGNLKRINYPTRGYSEITYESNSSEETVPVKKNDGQGLQVTRNCNNPKTMKKKFTFVSNGSDLTYYASAVTDHSYCGEPDFHEVHGLTIKDLTTGLLVRGHGEDYNIPLIAYELCTTGLPSDKTCPVKTVAGHTYEVEYSVTSYLGRIDGHISVNYNYRTEMENVLQHYSGSRVKKIEENNNENGSYIRNFYYNKLIDRTSQKTSIANANSPKYYDFLTTKRNCALECSSSNAPTPPLVSYPIKVYRFYKDNLINDFNDRSNRIFYKSITEVIENKTAVERNYKYVSDLNPYLYDPPVLDAPKSNSGQLQRGLLENEKQYIFKVNDFKIFKEIQNVYSFNENIVTSFIFKQNFQLNTGYVYNVHDGPIPNISYTFYNNYFGYSKLIESKEREFINNQILEIIENNVYANILHSQLTQKTISYTDNTLNVKTFQYAHEKGNTKLINANIVGIPLETTVLKKQNSTDVGKVISRQETKYDDPTNLFPSSVLSQNLQTNVMSTELTYDQYDGNGNLLQYTTKDGIPTAIIWGYNSTQPIAKVTGISYSVVSGLAAEIITASDADINAGTEQTLIDKLDAFRKNTALQNAQIATYTYDPLIGVTSITPPSGIREIYKYDSANRLESIKDVNGKIIKEFQYNYKH